MVPTHIPPSSVYKSDKSYFNKRNGLCFIVLSFFSYPLYLTSVHHQSTDFEENANKFRGLIYT